MKSHPIGGTFPFLNLVKRVFLDNQSRIYGLQLRIREKVQVFERKNMGQA